MTVEAKKSREDIERELTESNRSKQFEEFPKMLHHPEGHTKIVNSEAEQRAAGDEWQESPDDAAELKAARDGKPAPTKKTAK